MRALKNLCSPFQAVGNIRKKMDYVVRHPDPVPMVSHKVYTELREPVENALDDLAWGIKDGPPLPSRSDK
jgi:hypothetical protein